MMKILSTLTLGLGFIVMFSMCGLEFWWRFHGTHNLSDRQAGILLCMGAPGLALLILGVFFVSITRWRDGP